MRAGKTRGAGSWRPPRHQSWTRIGGCAKGAAPNEKGPAVRRGPVKLPPRGGRCPGLETHQEVGGDSPGIARVDVGVLAGLVRIAVADELVRAAVQVVDVPARIEVRNRELREHVL